MNKKVFPSAVFVWNALILGLLVYLPYYLFDGRLFLGGDDTRFYYAYPSNVLENLASFSWITISSLPSNIQNFHSLPFLLVSCLLDIVLNNKIHLFNFLFSLPLILGFLYFQKFIRELIGKEYIISFIAALIYIASPITVVSHISHFLTPVWLVALIPIISYYYVSFIRRGLREDIIKAVLWSIYLSIAYFAVVWLAGVMLPLICGAIFLLAFRVHPFKAIIKRTILFIAFIISSQFFWLVPFLLSMTFTGETELGGKVVSQSLFDSFSPTVLSTATGNIIYPLLTFYHRQIAIDYNWQVKNIFLNYWDNVLPFGLIFIFILFLGVLKHKQIVKRETKIVFMFTISSFIAALFFFTVNIGFLKYVFIFFGRIPGFSVFRNFTDKFSLGYIFIYSVLLSVCLLIIKKSYSKLFPYVAVSAVLITLINFIPVKQVVNSPVWTTKNINQTVNFPEEYLEFTRQIKSRLTKTSNIFSLPQNIASYSVITEENGINAYVGTSPFKFFTGINDLSGSMSYPEDISRSIQESIATRNYDKLLTSLRMINVGYVMITNNIPDEVKNSYLFDINYLKFQDKELLDAIVDKEVIKSSNENYAVYTLKNPSTIFAPTENIEYTKISPIKYEIKINNIKESQDLLFKETYHPGWRIYLSEKQNNSSAKPYFFDLLYAFKPSFFNSAHHRFISYGNIWKIDTNSIINSSNASSYEQNLDGSVNVYVTLFFLPQVYFYVGIITTILAVSGLFIYIKAYEA